MTLTAEILDFAGSLEVSQGPLAGESLTVLPWQTRFIRGAFRSGVRRVALSVARGNGKTTLVAAIAAAALIGPLAQRRGDTVIVASSLDQARIAFDHAIAFLGAGRAYMRVQNNSNRCVAENPLNGARVRALPADPRRLHGLAPALVLADEPSQWQPGQSDRMIAALGTSLGKLDGARLIALGTRPADSGHWFGRWLDGAADYAQLHTARDSDPIGQRRTWRKANPSLDAMPELESAIRAEAARAKLDAGELASFRALRLNLGTLDTARASLLDAGVWQSCEVETLPDASGPIVWGIDLGTSAAMSAVCAYWPQTGRLESLAAFPAEPGLSERGRRDAVGGLYQRMYERGELVLSGERTVNVAGLLREALGRFGRPACVVADRWREAELRDALDMAGVPPAGFVSRGQGFKDGAEDVRLFRRACIDGRVAAQPSLLLRSAMSEAVTVSDPAGNSKLAKDTQGGRRKAARDDAAAAAILAVAEGNRRPVQAPRPMRLHVVHAQ